MLIDVEEEQYKTHSRIIEFNRDLNGVRSIKNIDSFKPYFFISKDAEKGIKIDFINKIITSVDRDNNTRRVSVVDIVEDSRPSLLKQKLLKIVCRKPIDMYILRKFFKQTWEADIKFENRYITDTYDVIEKTNIRKHYIDIETAGIADLELADVPINLITIYDNYIKKYFTWGWRKDLKRENRVTNTGIVSLFNSEESMLNSWMDFTTINSPDLITGWNVEKFDLYYLINRSKRLNLDIDKISPLRSIKVDAKWQRPTVKGLIIFDMLTAFKSLSKSELSSYKLDDVAFSELGEKKIEIELSWEDMWNKQFDKLIEYNIKDVELVKRLDENVHIIEYYDQIRRIAKCRWNDLFNSTLILDPFFMGKLKTNFILPSRPSKTNSEKYKGATVLTPVKGLHKHIVCLDLKSLYPSIMRSINAGIETFVSKQSNETINVGNIAQFKKDKISFLGEIIEELWNLREKYKKLFKETDEKQYDILQHAVKVLCNSIYGAIGDPRYRLYKKEIAEAITFIGREIIEWTKQRLEAMGYIVVYGDTDSCFYVSKKTNKEDVINEAKELAKKITKSYDEFAKKYNIDKHWFSINFDKYMEKAIFTDKKKRYAYINEKGQLKITGFSSVRSDNPEVARNIQKRMIKDILDEVSKEEILKWLTEEDRKIRTREYEDCQIGFPQGLQKHIKIPSQNLSDEDKDKFYLTTNPCVDGARYSNKNLKTEFKKGMKPKWTYIRKTPLKLPHTNSIAFEDKIPDGFEPDWDKNCNRIFKMQLESLWSAAGFGDFPILFKKDEDLGKWF